MLFAYETNRLILTVTPPDQADAVLDFFLRDKELFERFEPDRMPNFYTLRFQKQMLQYEYNMAAQGTLFRFYIRKKDRPEQIIGTVCIHHIERGIFQSCEVGYKFSGSAQHQGYATEALSFVTALVFSDLKLHRIMAWVLPDNLPSIRLLQRVGFSCEGICRDRMYLHGRWCDHAQFCLTEPV